VVPNAARQVDGYARPLPQQALKRASRGRRPFPAGNAVPLSAGRALQPGRHPVLVTGQAASAVHVDCGGVVIGMGRGMKRARLLLHRWLRCGLAPCLHLGVAPLGEGLLGQREAFAFESAD